MHSDEAHDLLHDVCVGGVAVLDEAAKHKALFDYEGLEVIDFIDYYLGEVADDGVWQRIVFFNGGQERLQ